MVMVLQQSTSHSKAVTPSAANIRAHLICATTKHRLPYWEYKLLAEWLDCYQYILPARRNLRITPRINIKCSMDALQLWQLCDLYVTTLAPEEQLILALTVGKNYVCAISP